MTARRREVVCAALAAALGAAVAACLTPGQARAVGEEVAEIRRQVDLVQKEQEQSRAAVAALEPGAPSGPPIASPAPAPVAPAPSAHPAGGPPDALYRKGYALYHRGDYAGAEEALRSFLAAGPDSPLVGDARIWLGESLYARGRYREAVEELRVVAEAGGPGEHAPRALYKMSLCHLRLGEVERARRDLQAIVGSYSESDLAPLARAQLKNPRFQ